MEACLTNPVSALDRTLARRLDGLRRRDGLGAALEGLRRHQVQSGFIRDDLSEVRRFEFPHPEGDGRYFSAQFNPARARRFRGRGVDQPPPGRAAVNDGCFLCPENIAWQQQGAETGYPLDVGRVSAAAWMNPFPLAVGHAVIASRDHVHQHWEANGLGLAELVSSLIDVSDRLPGWITFYNGVGAGASVETHLHLHALPRTAGLPPMPIEHAAARHRPAPAGAPSERAVVRKGYPMDFVHWRGPREALAADARDWLGDWQRRSEGDADATANIMAVRHRHAPLLDVYFVPRARSRSRAEGLGGVIGAFETMGEIVCSRPEEGERLASGDIEHAFIEGMLRGVSVAL